jgi:serine protease
MPRLRARTAAATVVAAAALVLTAKAQAPAVRALQIENIGLPAVVEQGFVWDVGGATQMRRGLQRVARSQQGSVIGASGRAYTPGRVIVRFRDGMAVEERRSLLRLATPSGEITPRQEHADFDVVTIDVAEDAEAVAGALAGRPDVVYAQAAYRVHALAPFVPNDPDFQSQWNLKLINMERAWEIQPLAGSTVTVAVIDTGMAYRAATLTANIPEFINAGIRYPALGVLTIPYAAAPQLVGGAAASRIVAPYDVISRGINPPLDLEGHGTHVSGTIGQLTNDGIGLAGVAFNVRLMPVKVLGGFWDVQFGSAPSEGGSDDDVAVGIRYAADNGAKVINLSLGSEGPPDCGTNPNRFGCSPVVEAAMRYAVGKGVFIVVAGGNAYEEFVPPFGFNPTSVLAEIASRINGAISVAAVDPNKVRSWFSSTGRYIEIAAPGGSDRGFGRDGLVFQQTFDYHFTDTFDPTLVPPSQYRAPRFDVFINAGYMGTSMAAPHVAGVAAMLIQQGITDPAAIEAALEQTALDLGAPGRDDQYGFGLVDARAALRGFGLAR